METIDCDETQSEIIESDYNPSILALHGYVTSGQWMIKKLTNKMFNKSMINKIISPNGSYVAKLDNVDSDIYGWWPALDRIKLFEPNTYDPIYVSRSLNIIHNITSKYVNITTLIAFSQGCIFSLILLNKYRDWFPNLKKLILISPLDIQDLKFRIGQNEVNQDLRYRIEQKLIDIDCLIIIGEKDTLVPNEESMKVLKYFKTQPKIVKHKLGHVIPTEATIKKEISEFLMLNVNS